MTPEATSLSCRSTPGTYRKAVLELARKDPRVHEGELEIDENAVISSGDDNGAYVQAWLWVDFAGTDLDTTANTEGATGSAD